MTEEQTYTFPRIRPIEAFPIEYEGKKQICLRDPLGICPNPILAHEQAFFIITQFNGSRSPMEISLAYMSKFGSSLTPGEIQQLADSLDEAYLMDSPRFAAEFERQKKMYNSLPLRPASHAGNCYEADPEALRRQLDGILGEPQPQNGHVRGIVAPHIDIRLGSDSFAAAFNTIRDCGAELYVILGTAHMYSKNLFTVVTKDFETPLGPMPVDIDSIKYLGDKLGDSIFEDNFMHRNEHSIEFQTIFLRHILGPKNPARILPIMCASFQPLIDSATPPAEHTQTAALTGALRDIAAKKRVCFIAGVDFAHIGVKFGDPEPPTEETLNNTRELDHELIGIIARLDNKALLEHFTRDNDARRVCGMPALAVFTGAIDPASTGTLLRYDQSIDNATGSAVTFAAMSFS